MVGYMLYEVTFLIISVPYISFPTKQKPNPFSPSKHSENASDEA